MDGGNGNDIFVYSAVIQSTGVTRDLIRNFDFVHKIDPTAVPTGISPSVTLGTLSTASFDNNLAAAIGAGQLAAGHTTFFDPDAGDLNVAGHMFLVIDANGPAGYQADQSYVIELQSAICIPVLRDFI